MNRQEIAKKLKDARTKAGLTQEQVSTLIGRPQQTIGGWEKERSQPDLDTLNQLLSIYNCSPNFFFDFEHKFEDNITFGEKELIKKYRLLDIYNRRLVDNVLDAAYNNSTRNINPEEQGVTYMKCYELPAAAGTGEPLGDTYYTDTIQIPLSRVPNNAHICIRVHGDSMEPAYHDGDIVMVERLDGGSVREGEIGIFVLNGDGYIKRLGNQELISLNSTYDPIPIHDYDRFECQGRVLGKV